MDSVNFGRHIIYIESTFEGDLKRQHLSVFIYCFKTDLKNCDGPLTPINVKNKKPLAGSFSFKTKNSNTEVTVNIKSLFLTEIYVHK